MKNPFVVIGLAMLVGLVATIVMFSNRQKNSENGAPAAQIESSSDEGTKELPPPPVRQVSPSKNVATPANTNVNSETKLMTTAKATKLSSEEKTQLTLAIPKVSDIRAEVKKDPHATPASLINFASELGPKMELAMQSEPAAQFLFEQLKRCVMSGGRNGISSMQALCISDAQALGEKYTSLAQPTVNMVRQANPKAVELSKMNP